MTDPSAARPRRQLVAEPPPAPRPRRARRLGLVAVGILVALVAGELGARALADRLPLAYEWHTEEAELKVERMDELEEAGGVDVVFLGTSIVNGIDPALLTGADGRPVSAYNASLTAGVPPLMEAWYRDVVEPRLQPRVVVIGLSSFDLTDEPANRGEFFDAYLSSPAVRRLAGDEGTLEGVDRWIAERSELWNHRASLRRPDVVVDAIRGTAEVVPGFASELRPSGHTTFLDHSRFADGTGSGGGVPIGTWSIGTEDPSALIRLVEEVQASRSQVVLVDMPVTGTYVRKHPNGEADYVTYRNGLRALATDLGVRLVEMSDIRDDRLFADEVHLNGDGSAYVTVLLQEALRAAGLI